MAPPPYLHYASPWASFEAFVGVLYAGFCTAVLFGKVIRSQSQAQVFFFDQMVVRFGVEELNGIALCLCLLIHHLLLASPSPHFTRPIINQHLEQMKMLCHSWLIIFLLCNATINTRDCNGLSLEAAHRAIIASSMAKSELRANERSVHAREQCSKCSRPLVQCLCDALPDNKFAFERTEVLVLQHPTEFWCNTISTVPLLTAFFVFGTGKCSSSCCG